MTPRSTDTVPLYRLHRIHVRGRHQSGVASLTVVMMLFFAVALAAAYSSRNMIFEQRTTTNQLRSTEAFEAAQAGLEWAISMLNTGRVTDACATSTSSGDTSFRDRYLAINTTTAYVTARTTSGGANLMPSCVADAGTWRCHCPANGDPSLSASAGAGVSPAFRVRFVNVTSRPWTVQVEVNGCTVLSNDCLNFPSVSVAQEGRATVVALLSLRTGLSTPPGAAVTSRGRVGDDIVVYNTDASVNGITVQSGDEVDVSDSRLHSLPGTPGRQSRYRNDTSFADAALPGGTKPIGDRFFASFFGMWPNLYRDQPTVVRLDCAGGCSDTPLRTAIDSHPGRIYWISGDMSIDSAGDIGSTTDPVMVVMEGGSLTFTAAATLHGIVYGGRSSSATPDFEINGPGRIRGALISEHDLDPDDDPTIVYDKAIITLLRYTRGSFVMVPGSWRDF